MNDPLPQHGSTIVASTPGASQDATALREKHLHLSSRPHPVLPPRGHVAVAVGGGGGSNVTQPGTSRPNGWASGSFISNPQTQSRRDRLEERRKDRFVAEQQVPPQSQQSLTREVIPRSTARRPPPIPPIKTTTEIPTLPIAAPVSPRTAALLSPTCQDSRGATASTTSNTNWQESTKAREEAQTQNIQKEIEKLRDEIMKLRTQHEEHLRYELERLRVEQQQRLSTQPRKQSTTIRPIGEMKQEHEGRLEKLTQLKQRLSMQIQSNDIAGQEDSASEAEIESLWGALSTIHQSISSPPKQQPSTFQSMLTTYSSPEPSASVAEAKDGLSQVESRNSVSFDDQFFRSFIEEVDSGMKTFRFCTIIYRVIF